MATDRFLSGAWASVHGPSDACGLLTWVLDQGFAGVTAGPGPRSVDWAAVRSAMNTLPAGVACARVGAALDAPRHEDGSLASRNPGDRARARAGIEAAIQLARRLGCARVVLDPGAVRVSGEVGPEDLGDPELAWTPDQARVQRARRKVGRDAALDAVCRGLFELLKTHQDMEMCLIGSRSVLGLGEPATLAAIYEDLPAQRLSYWHDASIVRRHEELLGTPQGAWLEAFSDRMAGMTVADCSDGRLYLPPGSGGVDYPLLASYRRRSGRPAPLVVELDLAVEPGEIPGVHAFLSKFGL